MHPLRGGLLLQGLPPFSPFFVTFPHFLPYTGEYELRFSYAKKIIFSVSVIAGGAVCMHPDSSAGDRPFLYACSCPGSCCYGVFHNLTPFLFACTHRHALSGTHGFSFPRAYRHPGTHSLFSGADGRYSGTFLFLSGSTGGYRRIYCPKDRIRVHCCRAARRRSGR